MRLVFRADASPEIGSGHVMRCSAIAEEALSRGISAILVGATGGLAWLDQRLSAIGLVILNTQDFYTFENSVEDILIIDSYDRNVSDAFISRNNGNHVVAIVDDLTPQYPAELFIHPGIDGGWFAGDKEKFLSGPDFIPLRKSIRKLNITVTPKVKKVLVFGGGTDLYGFGLAVGETLRELEGFDEAIFYSSNQRPIESLDSRFRVVTFGASLDNEIENVDLVFTTASTSSLEVLAREIPMGIGCAVDNQVAYYNALTKLSVSSPIGIRADSGTWNLNHTAISQLISDDELRRSLIRKATGFIDLKGASRILDAILEL